MPVTAVNIKQRQPYAGGQPFGTAGPYQRIDGVLNYAVDPQNPANQTITDLQYAPVNDAGRVRFESDFTLVAPTDPSAGNGRLIVEVVNRGRRRTIPFFNRAPTPPITSIEIPEGDGFLLKHGYSVLSIGWQWDVYRSDALLGLDAPEIRINGQPVTGQACVEMRPNVAETTRLLANREHRPYPVADLNDPNASLRVRDWEDGPDTIIPRSQWHFPDPEHVTLESGFQPGKIYYVIYTAARPVVVGCGLLAIRDAAAWLRNPPAHSNPPAHNNPSAHGEPVEPPAHGEPVEPPAHGEPVEPPAHGEPVEPPAHGEPVEPPAHGEPVEPPAHGEPVEPPAHGEPVEPPAHNNPSAHGEPVEPPASGVTHRYEKIYAHGVSQSGRLLRTMAYLGLNVDEAGQPVFDGLLPHVAGGRMGEFNHRFAQPSCQSNPGFGHQFPFADDNLTDTLTEHTDGLLNRLRQLNAVPKIIYTDSAAEYWRGDACLTHVNSAGDADLDAAPETRRYLFAGAQHLPGAPDLMTGQGPDGSTGLHPYSSVDYIPLLRAALFNLDRWASDGAEPPPSQHPRLDDGTAVTQAAYLDALPSVPGQSRPDPARLWRVREIDLGPDASHGIAAYPVREGREYPHLVPAADADGNDRAGIRLPDLTVPVGAHTGWNLRHPDTGAPEQLMSMQGSTHWFAATAADRNANGDPRPSIAERYATRDDYAAQVKAAAQALAESGYLLAEDVELVTQSCLERYDHAIAQS